MARKIRLEYIQNDIARKTTFKKRKTGIVKKLDELTTLCAIQACLIIYSVYDAEPFVWPNNEEARRLIERFKGISAVDRGRRKVNQDTFMRQRLEKLEEKLRKVVMENRRKEMTHIMFQSFVDMRAALSMLDMGGYEEFRKVVVENIMEAQRMMDQMRSRDDHEGHGPFMSMSSNMTFPDPPTMSFPHGGAGGSGGGDQQYSVLSHPQYMMPTNDQFGRFQSYGQDFSMPNMMFPPPPPMAPNTMFSPPAPPPQGGGGAGGSGVGDQQLVLSNHGEFMFPNQYGMFQSYGQNFSMPNMMFPPPPMANMMFPPPPPQGGGGGAGPSGSGGGGHEQMGLRHHEYMGDPNNQYGRGVQSLSPSLYMPNMEFPPPNMTFPPPPNMAFPPNDMAYMDPNYTGMTYPISNQPMFPYYHNEDIGPQDSSFR